MFTGYVMCGICGGKMVARKIKGSIIYTCVGRADESCKNGKSYGEKLILPPVIDILANIINRCWGLDQTLSAAANQFGKTVNEEALEAAIQGEMAVVQAGKERLVQALVDGIFTQSEVSAKMEELRQKERDLTVELASISEKVKLRDSFVAAIEVLKRKDVRVTLRALADNEPLAFRQLLGIIIKPNSLRVRTFRKPGTSNQWVGEVISYELSDPIREFSANLSFSNVIL